MLLKLPIIFSSNYFILINYFQNYSQYIKHPAISLIYIAMVKLQYILLIHEVQKRFVVLSISKGIFSKLRCYGYE